MPSRKFASLHWIKILYEGACVGMYYVVMYYESCMYDGVENGKCFPLQWAGEWYQKEKLQNSNRTTQMWDEGYLILTTSIFFEVDLLKALHTVS